MRADIPTRSPASRPPARPARRRRPAVARLLARAAVFAAVLVAGVAGVVAVLARIQDRPPEVVRCAATLDGTDWYLEPDQADTAALLAGTALQRGLPARALTVALATGLQESKLRNLDHGDLDSVGVFQQRPSQGWGTVEQLMDPVYATNAFYDALLRVDGYQDLPVTEAAQAVQRSAFPEAYGVHEAQARAWASAMYGYSAGTVTCTLPRPDGAGDPQAVADRVLRDLGPVTATATEGGVLLDAAPLAASADAERLGWAVAHWAVSVAGPLQVTEVHHAGATWDRTEGTWTTAEVDDTAPAPGQVLVVLAD